MTYTKAHWSTKAPWEQLFEVIEEFGHLHLYQSSIIKSEWKAKVELRVRRPGASAEVTSGWFETARQALEHLVQLLDQHYRNSDI